MKIHKSYKKDKFLLRLAQLDDALHYYQDNFNPLDSEVARLTGCKNFFTKDEVLHYFNNCIEDENTYVFLIFNEFGKIIGESVINEIDWQTKSANYRIALFHSQECNKGIGTWAVSMTRDYAFEILKLHRLSLDVFSFNPRAEKVYLKAGFKKEGVLKDAIFDGEKYADDILMAILDYEWELIKAKS